MNLDKALCYSFTAVARPLRIQYPGAFYHVTSRGNERKRIFLAQADYAKFKTYLKEGLDRYGTILHCYFLMGNHYHLVVETPNANLSSFMQRLNSSYTTYFISKRRRMGDLFRGRFNAILMTPAPCTGKIHHDFD